MTAAARDSIPFSSFRARAWLVWSLAGLGFAFAFFMRVSPSVMSDELMREFAMGAAILGNLSAIYFYIYAGAQIPVGLLMDSWGPRRMLAGSMLVGAIGCTLFAFADTLAMAYLGRFLIGAGSGCAFVGGLFLAGRWFPPHRFALMSGLTMLAGMVGGLMGQAPLAYLVEQIGWRQSVMTGAAFGFALAVLAWLIVRDAPPRASTEAAAPRSDWRHSLRALANLRLWCALGTGACFSGPMLAFGALWGVPYMEVKFALSRPDAAFYVSLNLLGWAAGAPLAGWLSDHVGRRKLPLIVAGVVNTACMVTLFYLPGLPLAGAAVLIFLIGGLSASMVITYAIAREITVPSSHGAVTGFINTGTVGAGAITQPLVGLLLDWQWDGTMADGARFYSLEVYNSAFLCLVAAAILALCFALMLPETRCRPQVS